MRLWEIEEELFARGYGRVCGVDEAGRGPLAGPVFAAAVVLPPHIEIAGLNDSKKLSPKKREALFGQICETALDYCIASASAEEIDEINILQATYLAMNRAMAGLKIPPDMAIIDVDNMMSQPKGLTSASGIDVMTHALEAYVSVMATDYTDGLALKAIKNVFQYLPSAY